MNKKDDSILEDYDYGCPNCGKLFSETEETFEDKMRAFFSLLFLRFT